MASMILKVVTNKLAIGHDHDDHDDHDGSQHNDKECDHKLSYNFDYMIN